MKDALVALSGSRKAVVAAGALVGVALVLAFYKGSEEERTAAIASIVALAWKLVDGIAREDASSKSRPPVIVSPGDPEKPQ